MNQDLRGRLAIGKVISSKHHIWLLAVFLSSTGKDSSTRNSGWKVVLHSGAERRSSVV